ncbi:MAG TPA: 23S rRNA (adenine(2503)-C(2))-methyltransferase RlmN [bacterium]|nr:23S rRNA (adenine(2503)-C(2))-methyltransferase RlmN [bacterium]
MINLPDVKKHLAEQGAPAYRWRQFLDYYFSRDLKAWPNVEGLLTWPKTLKNDLPALHNVTEIKYLESADRRSAKAIIKYGDDDKWVETVLMRYHNYDTICLSSQLGCPLNCKFCATGQGGFIRNLTAEEIIEQFQAWLIYLNQNGKADSIKNLVFMGMGEPFLNWPEVKRAIEYLHDNYGIGHRHITISTAGLPDKIKEFSDLDWPVNLAISLHAGSDAVRQKLMPIANTYSLNQLWDSINYYFGKHRRKLFLEYILIEHLNDSVEEMRLVVERIKKSERKLLHVNMIPYNPHSAADFQSSSAEQLRRLEALLKAENIHYTWRDSLGQEIGGACGQLSKNS